VRINKSLITYIPASGAGSGTVTSVALSSSMPTGLSATITGSPITSSGTINLSLAFSAGYSIPTTTKQGQWDSAYAFTSGFPTGTAQQLLRYNTLGTALEFFTPNFIVSTDIIATSPLVWNSGTNTMSIPKATGSVDGYLAAADYITFGNKQDYITLTTTGDSGPATIIGATLNIPEYTLGGLGGFANPMTNRGDLIIQHPGGFPARFPANTTGARKYLSEIGDGLGGGIGSWEEINATTLGAVPSTRTLTINGTTLDLSADRTFSVGTVTSVAVSVPTGLSVSGSPITSSGTIAISLGFGYSIPTTASQIEWDIAFQNTITSLTTTGDSGPATLVSNVLNIPEYTLAGLGGMENPMTTIGDIIYANSIGFPLRRAGNITTTKMFLSSTGTGTSATAPIWEAITASAVGAVPTSRTLTINDVVYDLSANRSWDVGDYGTW
jgi:hypothetical protein